MKLSQAVFAYPRIELPYIKQWLDHHESYGVDHVYMTLHLNEPIDGPVAEEKIKWKKKLNAPYIMEGTELDLLKKLEVSIEDHLNRGRVTINIAKRNIDYREDTPLGDHIIAQSESYEWAREMILEKNNEDWDWMLVCDVDEFFLPQDSRKSIKDLISEEEGNDVSSLRCSCVNHPSRYDSPIGSLPWDTYTKNVGLELTSSKYIASSRRTESFSIHWSYPLKGYTTKFSPPIFIHHFCGFNKNTIIDNLIHAWPPENRRYSTKEPDSPFELIGARCDRPRKGPCN